MQIHNCSLKTITFINAFLDKNIFAWSTMKEILEAIADFGLFLLRTRI